MVKLDDHSLTNLYWIIAITSNDWQSAVFIGVFSTYADFKAKIKIRFGHYCPNSAKILEGNFRCLVFVDVHDFLVYFEGIN